MSQLSNAELPSPRARSGQGSNDPLEWSLRPWWRAVLLIIAVIAGGVVFSAAVIRAAESAYWADSDSISDIQRALGRDPANPDLLHRLGLDYTFNPTEVNTPEAVKCLRQAVALNPRRWDFWADLGTACDFVGNTSCSDPAFRRALALNPLNPALEWALGNHYLLTDRPATAFPVFRSLVALNPNYLEPTFRLCLRATHDPQTIYAQVIPHGKQSSERFAFLNFLVSTGDIDNAMKIWGQMISGPDRSPHIGLVKPFLDYLVDHGHLQDAYAVWSNLQHGGVVRPAVDPDSANLLYNPNFAAPPLNTGFDWRTSGSSDLVFDFADPSGYQGDKCLRIDFSVGRNDDYDLISQIVAVKPSTPYQLTAYVRSENLTSDSGPRLRVTEIDCGTCSARTSESIEGTLPWHPVDISFLTQPKTHALRVSFWRPKAPVALGDITGTVWLDHLTLRTVGALAVEGSSVRTP